MFENLPSLFENSVSITIETQDGMRRKFVGTVVKGNKPRLVQVTKPFIDIYTWFGALRFPLSLKSSVFFCWY